MRKALLALLCPLLLCGGASRAQPAETPPAEAPSAPTPLELETVLSSVERSFPLLEVARAERGLADGERRAAEGSFDTRIVARGDLRPNGFYESYAGDGMLEQQTRYFGARLFGGYRIGRGDFPSYDGWRQTDRDGEIRGGIELPLLRGRSIDPERARLAQAEIDRQRVEPDIELERVGFLREATVAYWDWVAAGREVGVVQQLLGVAEERQDQLEGRASRGIIPRIDIVDNERLIIDRRIRLIGAERDGEQAAIALSLFLRDEDGRPVVVGTERLPDDFPSELSPGRIPLEADLARARLDHPVLRSFALRREALEVELELARNDTLPDVDLLFEGSQDYGTSVPGISSTGSVSPAPRSQTELRAQVRFELPIQRRDARGRAAAATARLSRLDSRARFAGERIEAEIRLALAALEAAYDQTTAARDNLELAQRMRRAEERKLALGNSNLINVNIRELQTADAAVALIESQATFFRSLADYRAAVAVGP